MSVIQVGRQTLTSASNHFESSANEVKGVASMVEAMKGSTAAIWEGMAAAAFSQWCEQTKKQLDDIEKACRETSAALKEACDTLFAAEQAVEQEIRGRMTVGNGPQQFGGPAGPR